MKSKRMNTAYQHLNEGERFATASDGLCEDTEVATIYGVGCQYEIHQQGVLGILMHYLVLMVPFGPAELAGVVQREHLTWQQAMDYIRDEVSRELEDELNAD